MNQYKGTQTCRTCLASCKEMLSLEDLIENDTAEKATLLKFFLSCTKLADEPELPRTICEKCTSILRLSFEFIRNAVVAHRLLCKRLRLPKQLPVPIKQEDSAPNNGIFASNFKYPYNRENVDKRYRCKDCNVKMETKEAMKEHMKLHFDIFVFKCQLCAYETRQSRELRCHYEKTHNKKSKSYKNQQRSKNAGELDAHSLTKLSGGQRNCQAEDEDLELLIPSMSIEKKRADESEETSLQVQLATVITDENNIIPADLPNFNEDNASLIVGEYLMTEDGQVLQVPNNEIRLEYINNGYDTAKNQQDDLEDLDVDGFVSDDLIVEDHVTAQEESPCKFTASAIKTEIVSNSIHQIASPTKPKQNNSTERSLKTPYSCKFCKKMFVALGRLFKHISLHKDVAKYFCECCSFYTGNKTELVKHYRIRHNIVPAEHQLLARNDNETFASRYVCDSCDYDAKSYSNLSNHYKSIHLRKPAKDIVPENSSMQSIKRQIRNSDVDSYQMQLDNHFPKEEATKYFESMEEENKTATNTLYPTPSDMSENDQIAFTTALPYNEDNSEILNQPAAGITCNVVSMQTNANELFGDTFTLLQLRNEADNNNYSLPSGTTTTVENYDVPMIGETFNVSATADELSHMTSVCTTFIDNTDVAAVYTIPADGIPSAGTNDLIITDENSHLLNSIFDFGDDYMDEENENSKNRSEENFIYTSDEEDIDDFDDETSAHLQKPYCVLCKKQFTSQYQFENHMFLHRELAPYRCEQCTNVYNKKSLLIRHYQAVHKQTPSRDMVQAKGEKSTVHENTVFGGMRDGNTIMCCMCSFACTEERSAVEHLIDKHNVNELIYTIRKLPFECARCIRSFATEARLVRHLQRSHFLMNGTEILIAKSNTNVETPTTQPGLAITTSIPTSFSTTSSVMTNNNALISDKAESSFNYNQTSPSAQIDSMASLFNNAYQ